MRRDRYPTCTSLAVSMRDWIAGDDAAAWNPGLRCPRAIWGLKLDRIELGSVEAVKS
jgi:hypothetical protein